MKVVVLGGGSAGWLTAATVAAKYRSDHEVQVTLVEADDIPTIGVGEGTWPTMRSSLSAIGIKESEFLRYCNASFKQGSKFVDWSQIGKSYYHPFSTPVGGNDKNAFAYWTKEAPSLDFSESVCTQPHACELSKAPKQLSTPDYGGVLNYGYHLDAGKFGELLKKHCVSELGVEHYVAKVSGVKQDGEGYIQELLFQCGMSLAGDLFIDCSGQQGVLISGVYNIDLVDLSKTSINDRAAAVHVPYSNDEDSIASATVSTAQAAGWVWDIGLSSRRGVGYVYSSQFSSDDEAVETLRNYVSKSRPDLSSKISPKLINIAPGYRQKFWYKNCVAVGMAAGFIEPLEASALALVELSANFIRDMLPRSLAANDIVAKRFNEIFTYRWERIDEFLKLHYVLSKRRDTPYWVEVTRTDSLPECLQDKLELWRYRLPNKYDFLQIEELFPALSYQYVLFGMGFKTQFSETYTNGNAQSLGERLKKECSQIEKHLPTNRMLLNQLKDLSFPMA